MIALIGMTTEWNATSSSRNDKPEHEHEHQRHPVLVEPDDVAGEGRGARSRSASHARQSGEVRGHQVRPHLASRGRRFARSFCEPAIT